jgi:hypothetical protein
MFGQFTHIRFHDLLIPEKALITSHRMLHALSYVALDRAALLSGSL